jgi:hypothetical protein
MNHLADIYNNCVANHRNADFEVCKHPLCVQSVAIVGPDEKVHYRRPANHPDVLEAIALIIEGKAKYKFVLAKEVLN